MPDEVHCENCYKVGASAHRGCMLCDRCANHLLCGDEAEWTSLGENLNDVSEELNALASDMERIQWEPDYTPDGEEVLGAAKESFFQEADAKLARARRVLAEYAKYSKGREA